MGPGYKLTQEEIEMFAKFRSELVATLEGKPDAMTDPEFAADVSQLSEAMVDEHQSRDFYEGFASGLKLLCNTLRTLNAPRPHQQVAMNLLCRTCSLLIDAPK